MPRKESRRYSLAHRDRARGARDRGRRRWLCRSTVPISMSAMVAAEQLVDEGAVHLVCPFGGRLMLEFHRVTRCPTWAAEASPCAGTSMPCNPIVPEVPFGGELLSVISPLLPLGEVDDEGLCRPFLVGEEDDDQCAERVDEGAVHLVTEERGF